VCDFGSSKIIKADELQSSYVCSRHFRAPELLLGSTHYSTTVDMWAAGCVIVELLLGHSIFMGETSLDQLVEIIKVLGTPTITQLMLMNKNFK
jgi:serine/threonine protein kinase